MKLIAHRGCRNGPSNLENEPNFIIECIQNGFDAEIDIWKIEDKLYLGHDLPVYETSIAFLQKYSDKLWCHCKNKESFNYLLNFEEINCFWHQSDDYTLTSKKWIWVYPGKSTNGEGKEVIVMPELFNYEIDWEKTYKGICSDYVQKLQNEVASRSLNPNTNQ